MKMPDKFERLIQPAGSPLCGTAVCAMALGKTIDEVLVETDWRILTYISGISGYLSKYGITVGLWMDRFDGFPNEGTVSVHPNEHPAILAVKSHTYEDAEHWVFWDGKNILDPSLNHPNDESDYDILETHFLTYWEHEPHRIQRLAEDWRNWKSGTPRKETANAV
jgi:hypothetical protein